MKNIALAAALIVGLATGAHAAGEYVRLDVPVTNTVIRKSVRQFVQTNRIVRAQVTGMVIDYDAVDGTNSVTSVRIQYRTNDGVAFEREALDTINSSENNQLVRIGRRLGRQAGKKDDKGL